MDKAELRILNEEQRALRVYIASKFMLTRDDVSWTDDLSWTPVPKTPARQEQHITDAAWESMAEGLWKPCRRADSDESYRSAGVMVVTVAEWEAAQRRQNPPPFPPALAALEAKVAKLEAENESLSRQLRSRDLNREPVATKPVFRWGRPV